MTDPKDPKEPKDKHILEEWEVNDEDLYTYK